MLKEIRNPRAYRRPLCLTQKNEESYPSPLLGQPICETCFIELDQLFSGDVERPEARIVDRVEEVTGLAWNDCLAIVLRENLEYWQNLEGDPAAFRERFEILSEMLNWTESRVRDYVRGMIGYYEARITETTSSNAEKIYRDQVSRRNIQAPSRGLHSR